eukprot:scaffold1648_cov115-Cylindrotheca_fusiformis.AAC.11
MIRFETTVDGYIGKCISRNRAWFVEFPTSLLVAEKLERSPTQQEQCCKKTSYSIGLDSSIFDWSLVSWMGRSLLKALSSLQRKADDPVFITK